MSYYKSEELNSERDIISMNICSVLEIFCFLISKSHGTDLLLQNEKSLHFLHYVL